jgi:hypothetical protein
MSKQPLDNFYEELEHLEHELTPVLNAERAALQQLLSAKPEERAALLEAYLRAIALMEGVMARRRRFLETYRPSS